MNSAGIFWGFGGLTEVLETKAMKTNGEYGFIVVQKYINVLANANLDGKFFDDSAAVNRIFTFF